MNFEIKKRNIFCCGKSVIGDNSDYIANFIFDSEWDYKIKTARFQRTNGEYVDVILENDSCKIPVEVLKFGYLSVGVFTDEMTTTYCDIFVKASIKEKNGNPIEPTPDVYAQIIEMLEDISENGVTDAQIEKAVNDYLTENPVTGVDEAEVQSIVADYINLHKAELKGEKGDKGDKGDTGASGKDGVNGADGADGADGKSAYDIAVDNGFEGTEAEWLESLKGEGTASDVTTKILIDTLYARNMKNNFAFRDMPTAQCVLILDDCLPSVITTCVNNAIAKNVPLNMGAISNLFNTLTKQETETVLEAIKRGIANGGEVLLHGDGTINESNINDENYLKQKFLDEKEAFIANGLNPRGVIVIGGGDEIYGDIRTDRWVRALFDYSDGYGTSEPYYHRRFAPTTLEQAKAYIDNAVANKSFCPIFAHKWYDFWDEMIDYAVSKGAVWTTYANVYDTYGTTTSVKELESRLKALESNSGNVKTLVSISASKTKTTYSVNDTLETDDITVIATYSDESTADVTADAVIDTSNVVMSAAGSYEIAVSYSGKITTIMITVEEKQTGAETVIYQAATLSGTCDGTKDTKVGDSSTQWTSEKQYRYVFDYEVTSVQDSETTVAIRDVNGSDLGVALSNAIVGQNGHVDRIINNGNTRQRQAFLLKNYDKSYSVTLTNVVITEL